jgi:biofilm PGA synthesis lipoprotein PgaB
LAPDLYRGSFAAGRFTAGIIGAALTLLCLSSPLCAGSHAVILQYHHIGTGTPPSTSVTPRQFENHLEYLEKQAITVWPVEKIVSYLQQGKELPERCVGITIDDAYTSVYERALPLLKKHGYPFTVFVTTAGVDKGFKSYMTWSQMREMRQWGATFAGHSHSHDFLVRRHSGETEGQWARRVKEDIGLSIKRLREELGSLSPLFAYPYGEYNSALREIVLSLSLVGFGQQSGILWKGSDFAALPRFPMSMEYADMDQFAEKVNSLPLPVLSAVPEDPLLPPGISQPLLRLKLAPGQYLPSSLACYADGQGQIPAVWTDAEEPTVEVAAPDPLPPGRSRYTCTARHRSENRYYWYSHLWIRDTGR